MSFYLLLGKIIKWIKSFVKWVLKFYKLVRICCLVVGVGFVGFLIWSVREVWLL